MNTELPVLDEFIRHKEMLPGEARSYLAQYLFRNEDVFKPVSALSGGERARLALAILALEGANLLLLDEPTNHLDIPAREALQEVLEKYNGTVLLVSHDRYLIDRLATQVWEIKDNKLQIFQGSYREYLLRVAGSESINGKARQAIQPSRPMARDNSKETRRREERLDLIEERIHSQENALRKAIHDLQKAGENGAYEEINQLSMKVSKAQAVLDDLMAEWEKLAVA